MTGGRPSVPYLLFYVAVSLAALLALAEAVLLALLGSPGSLAMAAVLLLAVLAAALVVQRNIRARR